MSVQVIQDGLKLNGSHQTRLYADSINILSGSVYIVKGITEALIVTSKKTGLEANADKNKYMVTSRDQNARRRHNIQTDYYFY
jgi:ribonuclease HI